MLTQTPKERPHQAAALQTEEATPVRLPHPLWRLPITTAATEEVCYLPHFTDENTEAKRA